MPWLWKRSDRGERERRRDDEVHRQVHPEGDAQGPRAPPVGGAGTPAPRRNRPPEQGRHPGRHGLRRRPRLARRPRSPHAHRTRTPCARPRRAADRATASRASSRGPLVAHAPDRIDAVLGRPGAGELLADAAVVLAHNRRVALGIPSPYALVRSVAVEHAPRALAQQRDDVELGPRERTGRDAPSRRPRPSAARSSTVRQDSKYRTRPSSATRLRCSRARWAPNALPEHRQREGLEHVVVRSRREPVDLVRCPPHAP